MEDDDEEDEEGLYVNVARIGQEEDDWQEPDDSWLDLDGGENEDKGRFYCISAYMRKDDSGLEEELEYFPGIVPNEDEEEVAEDRWWSPEPSRMQSEEEDEKADRYINSILTGECDVKEEQAPASASRGHEVNTEAPVQEGCSMEEGQAQVSASRDREADDKSPTLERPRKRKGESSGRRKLAAARRSGRL
jgi:hypothetical protein